MLRVTREKLLTTTVLLCLLLTVFFEISDISFLSNDKDNFFFANILTLVFGSIALFLLMNKEGTGLFKQPKRLCFFFLGLVIAVDNFQFAAFFFIRCLCIDPRCFK